MIYRVRYNRHKYEDNSDTPTIGKALVPADNAEEAGYKFAEVRDSQGCEGLRTKQGNRYYIGIIHFQDIEQA